MAGNGNNRTHGMSHSRPWVIWTDMKRRCNNPSRGGFEFYGQKGVTYQPSWEHFSNFWDDMKDTYGDDLTLERKDPHGNYTKENCEWIPRKQQAKNKKKYKNNKTGVDGTYFMHNKGILTLKAHISFEGVMYTKSYSLCKYSLEVALDLARHWRKEMKEKFGYGELHGS